MTSDSPTTHGSPTTRSRRTRHVRVLALGAATAVAAAGLGACAPNSGVPGADPDQTVLRYWMWDSSQLPGHRQCAADFEDRNPDIHINLEQYGWDDYWTQITASMVAENAPDIFVDHTSQFGKYASLGQILDLQTYVDADNYDLDQFQPGLAGQWLGEDGRSRYGIPKDWDTVGVFYNTDMVRAAGYSDEDLWNLSWNPEDGGTYEKFLAHMSIDQNGVRGDEPGFDKNRVTTYGLGYNQAGSGYGQVPWSAFALSNGEWRWIDQNPWGRHFNYDDPHFQDSIGWYRSLIEKGYMPSLAQAVSGVGTLESLGSGGYATIIEGSWNVSNVLNSTQVPVQVAPTPIGPDGHRATVMNGLADSVWVGTKHPEEAWRFIKYMGSQDCQDVIAQQAVVFPAISSSSEKAVKAFEDKGMEARAFSIQVEQRTGVTSPVVDRWAQMDSIMNPAMAAVKAFQADPSSLSAANQRVNDMMARDRE
ncbi:MAG: sugar ABC transporter substrate-binding protein [Actinomyces sp.]|nr:sugar ABC transporter substrate-binding protein [Actinomyces sp.]